ncbi:protein phosphatase 1 regulatory subunit 1C isoform X4 [Betta splendens]|uniref:Protein phosphatase 1 regulatory subunit 1C isoform X4 n=1 Tax=Betta splendens TaxID=158456 RepID=A0A6P7PQ75_BETSP|nr:protein phosphatase 1 regulatory subunit 1C isoform X4 [Betta splendens]
MEPSSPKKIQFAVPPLQGQLDPQAAEHIRRRRPTPATLQIYRQPGTDVGDQHNASGDSQASESSQRKQSTFTPPPMTELQQGAEQHLLEAGLCDTHGLMSPITAQLYELWANHNGPEETNGNEAGLQIANQERGVAESSSTGGKCRFRRTHQALKTSTTYKLEDLMNKDDQSFKVLLVLVKSAHLHINQQL